MALIDDFKARFPEFDSAIVDSIVPTLEGVWQCYYGGSYDNDCDKEVILNLIAHLFAVETSAGTGSLKSTQSESVGSVSVSYSSSTGSGGDGYDFFKTTKYGKSFMMLTQKRSGAFFV